MKSTLEHALDYLRQGISVIPSISYINPKDNKLEKKPAVKWTEYQSKLPTETQLREMFGKVSKPMVSIVTGQLSGIMVVDTDSPEATKQVEDVIPDSCETTVAVSPRGGKHFYFKCDGKWQSKNAVLPNIDIKANGGLIVAPPSRNTQGGEYRWLTSLDFDKSRLLEMPEALCKLLESAKIDSSPKFNVDEKDIKTIFNEGRRDNDLFHLALALRKSGESKEYILQVLINLTKFWKDNNTPKYLSEKVISAFQYEEKKDRNLAEEVREWVAVTSGYFIVTNCYIELHAVTKESKTAIRVNLHRLLKEGVIEKDKTVNGKYRKLDTNEEVIDYLNVTGSCLDIKFPFQIENYVRIMPKNIIVIAGEPDAGKTAFLMNMVKMNMDKHEIFYFSSEMGAMELKDRLKNFDYPIDKWRFKPIERSNDFADVIRPDAINIIDFLEISDNFYMISGLIKSIYDKLDKGIAIIALQKNKGTDYGLGGMRSLEKPRLYLSMSPGMLKIVKAKNWVSSDKNPNRLQLKYSLYKGCHFTPLSGWIKDESK